MKPYFKLMALLLFMASLQNCAEDEPLRPEKVQFSFALSDSDNPDGGRIKNANIPDGTFLQISLETTSGAPVLTNHKVNLLKLGSSIITEPFELLPNHYIVTDFMLVNNGQILYACPRKGSPLAQAVINPLPFGFTVMKNKVTNVEIEVMDAKLHTPKDFGYGSFNINIKNAFQLAVFTTSGGQTTLTAASVYILQGGQFLTGGNMEAKVNLLSFGGNPEQEYTLYIYKENFIEYNRTFYLKDLLSEIGNLPLKVLLKPVTDMHVYVDENTRGGCLFYFEGNEMAKINIDWGDGKSETVTLSDEPDVQIEHWYGGQQGIFHVRLTGDLDQIKRISSGSLGQGVIYGINLKHLTALTSVDFALSEHPKKIDFRHNTKLQSFSLFGLGLEEVILPTNHQISYIIISGPTMLNTANVDALIGNIYNNVTTRNMRNGYISLQEDIGNMEDDTLIGPPSAEGLAKLNALKSNYGWSDPWE